jgi:hypothetical protein
MPFSHMAVRRRRSNQALRQRGFRPSITAGVCRGRRIEAALASTFFNRPRWPDNEDGQGHDRGAIESHIDCAPVQDIVTDSAYTFRARAEGTTVTYLLPADRSEAASGRAYPKPWTRGSPTAEDLKAEQHPPVTLPRIRAVYPVSRRQRQSCFAPAGPFSLTGSPAQTLLSTTEAPNRLPLSVANTPGWCPCG